MPSKVTFQILDYSGETGSVGFWLPTLTAANFDANVNDTVGGAVGDLRIAMNALINGNHLQRTVNAATFKDTAVQPTDPYAQREIKGRFVIRDTVTAELGSFEIPCIDLSVVAQQGTDVIDLEEVAVAAFVAVLEADYVSRDGNPIEVVSAQIVGRSN